MGREIRCDLAIVGGGLAGGLIAHALAVSRPEVSVCLIEPSPRIGGRRLWTFFSNDVAPVDRWIIAPFVSRSWNGCSVRMPDQARDFGLQYNAVRSGDLDAGLRAILPPNALVTGRADGLGQSGVRLADGSRVRARGVIDARGAGFLTLLDTRWHIRSAREFRLRRPHSLPLPVLMDATVAQDGDGMRYMECLPIDEDRVLIADHHYADTPRIDSAAINARIHAYADAHGWPIAESASEEAAILPVILGGDFEAYWKSGPDLGKTGARAGLGHPVTGSALPDAVRLAALIARQPDMNGTALRLVLYDHARKVWRERAFYRMVGRMLFQDRRPAQALRLFERLYRLRPDTVSRFHAAASTRLDRIALRTEWLPLGRSSGGPA